MGIPSCVICSAYPSTHFHPSGPTIGEFGDVMIDGRSVPVTASVVDQQASLYGHGCRRPGDSKITFGTGAFALVLTGESLYS